MNNYLLYEVGVEEMPSRFVESTVEKLKENLSISLTDNRIGYDTIKTYATPRRLILVVEGIAPSQTDLKDEVKGPSKKIAVSQDGSYTKAAMGFMNSKGLKESDVYFKEIDGTEYLFATKEEKGKPTKDVLMEVLPEIVKSVVFPKSMKWGGKNLRFVRPIRWLVALLNDEIVPVDLEGIVASNITVGHRFLGKREIEVSSIEDYFKKLRENFVIYDQNERREMILSQIEKVADSIDGKVDMDEELLDEVVYIVEYPTAFYGEFDKKYVSLPKEVVKTPMKAHQRYFPVLDKKGDLLPNFIAVRNGNDYRIENVKKGNEKVLEARLADALFFFDEDRRKSLEQFRDKLSTVVFQEKLGTLLEKSDRIYSISSCLNNIDNLDIEKLKRAAYLSKADLVTNMVFEFDELQGYMGMEYAKLDGEDQLVSNAIYEHYLPRFSGDSVPDSLEGAILSIVDRIDTIAGFFAIGITPTGSADPFALRRQCLGILTILLEKNIELDIKSLISIALDQYKGIDFDKEKVEEEILDFFNERLKNMLKDMGIRYDVVDAVLGNDERNIADLYSRAMAINKWIDRGTLTDMLVAFNRVSTLAEKASNQDVNVELFVEDVEKNLYENYLSVNDDIKELMNSKEYTKALDRFASLKPSIDDFFEGVMVMDENEKVRENRLSLLNAIYTSMLNICDLSKIVYK